ncbi:MAG: deoxyribose-phosphate aldolase [Myxococcaceae bacterium]
MSLEWALELAERTRARLRGAPPSPPSQVFFSPAAAAGTDAGLAAYLDHTLLRVDATTVDIDTLADEAKRSGCAGACVHSRHIGRVARRLEGSKTLPIAVVGFPQGATLPRVKVFEARAAYEEGARELDVVADLGAIRESAFDRALDELIQVTSATPLSVKVIIETSLWSDAEKVQAAVVAELAGAAFVKTSTGFQGGGATEQDIRLLRRVLAAHVRVKASGGIRTAEQAWAMVRAGAHRVGTSSAPALVAGESIRGDY